MTAESTGEDKGFNGLRVLSLESRRAEAMRKLIENHGGSAIIAPSMREIPLSDNSAALAFADGLLAGKFDAVIFLTGVGTRMLFEAIETKYSREQSVRELSQLFIVARGPKPAAALRELGISININVPEPNTWGDILNALDEASSAFGLDGKRVALQEYGVSNPELIAGLQARGAMVTVVPVYQWSLPEDIEPLRRAIDEIAAGRIDVLLVTSANQIHNLVAVSEQMGRKNAVQASLPRAVVASIGPVTSEGLRAYGIAPDFEPSHPKMGNLVLETASRAHELLSVKRKESGK